QGCPRWCSVGAYSSRLSPSGDRVLNYIQVEPEAVWNIQRPPDIREDTVLYATILPHTSPPTNPHISTDKVSQ
ncbi:hypothetical protein GBAR_LOCUS2689, partial [Geodia barretti]